MIDHKIIPEEITHKYGLDFSMNRFIIEFFRTNPMIAGPLSIAHVYSILIIGVTLLVMNWLKKRQQKVKVDVENTMLHEIKENWSANLMIVAAAVVSVMVYYWVHAL